jgi:hypothetical protein
MLREPIHHSQNQLFAANFSKVVNEIHGNITPYLMWNQKRLQQTPWVKMFSLIALANFTALHELPHTMACL